MTGRTRSESLVGYAARECVPASCAWVSLRERQASEGCPLTVVVWIHEESSLFGRLANAAGHRPRASTAHLSIERSAGAAGRAVKDSSARKATPSPGAKAAQRVRRSSARAATPSSAERAAKRVRRSSAARDTRSSGAKVDAA